jgi:hypothetical protein
VSSLADHGLFPDTSLEVARAVLCRHVDERAEVVRQGYLTPGTGQALTYVLKRAEAEGAVVDPAPTAEAYPLLQASVGIEGDSLRDVAGAVLTASAIATRLLQLIEQSRLGAKRSIKAAATAAEALAVVDAIAWLPE